MNDPLEYELTGLTEAIRDAEDPGAQQTSALDATVAREQADASNVEAEKAWRASGISWPYDYEKAYAQDKVDFAKGELPNKHFPARKVEIAGHDLVSGEQYHDVVKDTYLLVTPSRAELAMSTSRVKGPAPAQDVNALGKIAYAFVLNNKTYEEFSKSVPQNWSEDHRKLAWKAGIDSANVRRLERQLQDQPAPKLVPATLSYAETMADKTFSASARQVYKAYTASEFKASDAEASEW